MGRSASSAASRRDRISQDELVARARYARSQIPGVSNAWTMPIKARTVDADDRHPHAGRAEDHRAGPARRSTRSARASKRCCRACRGTRSVFAERSAGGYFLDVDWKREELARYGLSIDEAQSIVQNAIGGENVTTTIEGRERYPVNVRYCADFRSDIGDLGAAAGPAAGRAAADPAGAARDDRDDDRAVDDPQRERPAHRLRLRRPRRSRRRAATSRTPKRVVGERLQLPAGVRARLERPVRGDEPRPRAAARRRAAHALPASSLLLYLNTRSIVEDGDRAARGAVLGDRRVLVPLPRSATT